MIDLNCDYEELDLSDSPLLPLMKNLSVSRQAVEGITKKISNIEWSVDDQRFRHNLVCEIAHYLMDEGFLVEHTITETVVGRSYREIFLYFDVICPRTRKMEKFTLGWTLGIR